jgi:uncharacterized protein YutE (UPF0331/DUF86 family)
MTTKAVIENKIAAVKKYLKILERYKGRSPQDIERDVDLRGAVERYLYLTVQAAIDLANAVIAFGEFRKPVTMGEIFSILLEEKVIGEGLAVRLTKMVGFRNILAHDYGKIDYDVVGDIMRTGRKDIEKFLAEVSRHIR